MKVRVLSVRNDDIYAENLDMRDSETGSPYIYYIMHCVSPSGFYRCPLDQGVTYKARVTKGGTLNSILVNRGEVTTTGQTWACDPSRNADFKRIGAHWEVQNDGKPHCEAGRGETRVVSVGDSGGGNLPVPAGSTRLFAFVVYWPELSQLKAGYHVTGSPRSDCPGWHDRHGDPQGPGNWGFEKAELVSGSLPPGLSMNSSGDIEGTPEQPGNWTASVRFSGLYCRYDAAHGSKPIDIGSRNAWEINFNVQGDAPRRVR